MADSGEGDRQRGREREAQGFDSRIHGRVDCNGVGWY
jgi:hypothetical protein